MSQVTLQQGKEFGAALHADFSSAPRGTEQLVTLVTIAPASSPAPLALYSAIHSLLFPLVSSTPPSVSLVASYFSDSLFPALRAAKDAVTDPAERVADVIIDVVWQIDQEIENGMLQYRTAASTLAEAVAPSGEEMDVDGCAGSKDAAGDGAEATASAESAAEKELLRQQQNKKQEREGRQRLAELVKILIAANILSANSCLERLETTFVAVEPLALIKDQPNFARLEIRSRTAVYYKQQKFNLLREESEGYSKLIVELLSNMGPPHSVTNARSQESESQRVRRAKLVGDSVKSLIGNFNLDPDRALDIVLDTFSDQIVQHHQFFIDFLAHSPWAPKKPSNGTSKVDAEMDVDDAEGGKGKAKAKEPLVDVGLEGDRGSFLIGQVLGFKFSFYQGATVEETPEKLYFMTALLIWNGFVKLADLYPHLSPGDDVLAKTESVYREAQAQLARAVGGSNALALAGALVDDDSPSRPSTSISSKSAAEAAAASAKRDLPHQKLGLLRALLSIGDLAHSLFILAQYPFLVSAYPDLADLLLRLLAESIAPAYATISVAKEKSQYSHDFTAAKPKFVPATTAASKVAPVAPATMLLSGSAFPDPNKEFVFFFADWRERLPKAQDWEEVLEVLELFLPFVGVFVSRNFSLYTKLCRIISRDIRDEHNDRMSRWIDLIRQFLLPAISLLEYHTVAAIEIWTVLSCLPIEARFTLYGEWKDSMYRRIPALTVRKAEAERDVKNVLRRLSTDNVKKLGKTLAKIAHTNPAIIFAIVLNQVQSYDNLIVPVVEAARYLCEFGYDVMTFSLLDALSSGKTKTKEDGTSTAMWLQGLASFAGQLYRRWAPMSGSMWVIFQYLVNQLVSGNSKDLVILREFITRMSGLEPFADLSDAQVMSLAGGRVLRSEVFNQTDISQAGKRPQVVALQNAKIRLTHALRRSGLAMPLLVNIAIQRQACLSDTEAHLKSLGGLFDQCHAVLFQYIEFLRSAYEPDDLAAEVPTISDLMERWGIEAAVAFDIARPKLRAAMKIHEKDIKEQDTKATESKRKAGLAAKLAQEKAIAAGSLKIEEVKAEDASPANGNGDVAMADAAAISPAPQAVGPVWHPGLLDVIKTADNVLPEQVRLFMGSPFFVTFWQLTLYDIVYPKERYDSELVRCSAMSREANSSLTLKTDDKRKFSDGVSELARKLTNEFGEHATARGVTQRRLTREKGQWFAANVRNAEEREQLVLQIIQYCIHPRAKLSLPDAAFSYQFIKRMHTMDTPAFRTAIVFDKILNEQLGPVLYSCTENEARNYARFLFDMLADLNTWYKTEALYKLEAISSQTHGFVEFDQTTTSPETAYITWDKYKILMQMWQRRMVQTFGLSLESGEYMHIKNSILVLTKIAPYFPIQHSAGVKLEKSVAALIAAEKREDLKILASGYKAVLYKRRKHWLDQPLPEEPKARAVPSPAPAPVRAPAVAAPAPSGPSRRASPVAVSTSAATSTSTSSSSVPTGPKFGLPAKPGASNGSTPRPAAVSRPSENDSKPLAMDADKPSPALAPSTSSDARPRAEPSRRPADLNSRPTSTSSRDAPPASSFRTHSSLPQRPGQQPSATLVAPETLRQQALASQGASKRTAAAMEPPAAPASSSRREPTLPSSKRDSPPPLNSRPASPRHSDSGRRDRNSRDGDSRGDRSGKASRDRSPSPVSRRLEKDKYESKDRQRDDDHRRGSRDDRSRDSRGGRDDRRDRDSRDGRTKERDGDRGDDRSRSSRDPPRGPKDDDKRSVDSRRRDPEPERRISSSSRAPETSRSDAREADKDKDSRMRRELSPPRRTDGDSQRGSSRPQAPIDRVIPPLADAKVDRLKPAPAHATSAGATGPESALSIKGRGSGNRIFASALGGGGRDSTRKTSGSSSRPRDEPKKEEREDESKKRPSSSTDLLGRLDSAREDGQEAKRARTDDADEGRSRDPPPHVRGGSDSQGQERRSGGHGGGGGGSGRHGRR